MPTSDSTNHVGLGAGLSVYSCSSFLILPFFLLVMLEITNYFSAHYLFNRAAIVSLKYIQKVKKFTFKSLKITTGCFLVGNDFYLLNKLQLKSLCSVRFLFIQ